VYRGNGNDTVVGIKQDDVEYGEDGDDFLGGGDGNDSQDGGDGMDRCDPGAGSGVQTSCESFASQRKDALTRTTDLGGEVA
jgi:hypothetical protein